VARAGARSAGLIAALGLLAFGAPAAAALDEREARCLAMIAYAEAAIDGSRGMAAVIEVVRNRQKDARFPRDVCAVVAAPGEFQPISESAELRRAVRGADDTDLVELFGADRASEREAIRTAERLALLSGRHDPTGGALYFVNPRYMDPAKCPWFAKLKRTAEIGGHVFMTHYGPDETPGKPAIDCATAGRDYKKGHGFRLPNSYRVGPFDPRGPRVATRTATRAMLQAWKRTGQLEKRGAELRKRHFKPNWWLAEGG
jgi:hypothetical protein